MARTTALSRPNPYLISLCVMFVGLWLAGSATRPDVLGQAVIRGLACVVLASIAIFGARPSSQGIRAVVALLAGIIAIPLLQLLPLPPSLWQALPGRTLLVEAANLTGSPQPWRPLSMVPSATFNAVASLIVPLNIVVVMSGLTERERGHVPGLILGLITAHTIVGLLQFSGAGFNNPFSNDTPGHVSGMFANRNHFALMLAIGCLVAPVWAFEKPDSVAWRAPLAIGLIALFLLSILASGSRAGLGLAAAALAIAAVLTWAPAIRALRRQPKWLLPSLLVGLIAGIVILVLASLAAGRAVSIDRLLAVDPAQDMRQRALPTLIAMIGDYMPWGSGLGGFDTVFRIHEPYNLLKPTYFNHAHNDYLEIAIDAGIPGVCLLISALFWWLWASVRAWRLVGAQAVMPKLGSGVLFLLIAASAFDYPARTPVMMAVIAIAGIWLANARRPDAGTLPTSVAHL